MRRGWLSLLWVALAGCGSGDVVLGLPDELAEAGAVLFVVDPTDGEMEVHASDGASARLELTTTPDLPVRITALAYGETLEALGLVEGRLALEDPATCGARALPPQDDLHEVTIDGGPGEGWRALSVRSSRVDALRLPGACPCSRFEIVDRTIPPVGIAAFIETDRPDELTVLTGQGQFWRLTADLEFTPRVGTATAPVENLRALESSPDGRLWLGLDAALWRGSPTDGFERMSIRENSEIRSLAGGTGRDGYELFGANEAGELWRYEPGPPVRWSRPQSVPFIPTQVGRVVWLGPGEVVATEHAAYDVLWMKDGLETGRVELPPDSGGAFFLKDLPGLGLTALTTSGRLFHVTPDLVETLPGAPEIDPPASFLGFRGGLLYSGNTGYLQEYRPDYGFCPTQQIEGQPRVLAVIPFDGRLAVLGIDADPEIGWQLLMLEPVPY